MDIAVVIPAYNEEQAIRSVLEDLQSALSVRNVDATIIVVDDGSTDRTAAIVENIAGVALIRLPMNRGYGAALKTGIRAAASQWVVTYDADGQHTPEALLSLIPHLRDGIDMVVGKREGYQGPALRQPGKWLLSRVADRLAGTRIPDLNSGLRAFRKETVLRYLHLFPNGFSLSTTSTVCFLKEGLSIHYVPIRIRPRTGKSTVSTGDGFKALMCVVRLIMLFSPLRIFLPVSILTGGLGAAILIYGLATEHNVSDSATLLVVLGALLFFVGLLADQLAAVRRELHRT